MICSLFFSALLTCYTPKACPKIYDQKATFTAYSLEASQTDGSPCIGAGGHNLCEIRRKDPNKCIVATRSLNLHRNILIEGIGKCEVLDRTSKKYGDRVDIVANSYAEAIQFGKKELRYRVID